MEDSVSIEHRMIIIRPGINPNCLTAAGRAMIPAPTIVVERLKMAPENDAPSKRGSRESWSSYLWGRRGTLGLRRHFRSPEGRVVISFKIWTSWPLRKGKEWSERSGGVRLLPPKTRKRQRETESAIHAGNQKGKFFFVGQTNEVLTRVQLWEQLFLAVWVSWRVQLWFSRSGTVYKRVERARKPNWDVTPTHPTTRFSRIYWSFHIPN